MTPCINCQTPTKNPKFCSRACSASYNTKGRKHSLETKYKISKTHMTENTHIFLKSL